MVQTVKFGSLDAARRVRNNPKYKQLLADSDSGNEKTVRLEDDIPDRAVTDIVGEAADSKAHEAEKYGQSSLSKSEKKQIDFTQTDILTARSAKAIAEGKGVDDWTSYFDETLSTDENRAVFDRAKRDERGSAGLGVDRDSSEQVDKRMAEAHRRVEESELDHAKSAGFEGDADAQEFVQNSGGLGDVFDVSFARNDRGALRGSGKDFDRMKKQHENRSQRAQTVDEQRTAKTTRDPFQWSNNPNQYDYPGIDTVDPRKIHNNRSDRAKAQDERELAPIADSKEQWAQNQDRYDWRGVDTPSETVLDSGSNTPITKPSNATTRDLPSPERNTTATEPFTSNLANRDISLAPEEAFEGVGAVSQDNSTSGFGLASDEEADALFAESEERRQESGGGFFTDDRNRDNQLTDFGMETDATQHRDSRQAEEQATSFGLDDRDDASRGAENEDDGGNQQGFEVFGGGVRENETLF